MSKPVNILVGEGEEAFTLITMASTMYNNVCIRNGLNNAHTHTLV